MNHNTDTKHDTTEAESPSTQLTNALACARTQLDWLARSFHEIADGTTDEPQITIYASIAALLANLATAEDVAGQVTFLAERGQKAYLTDGAEKTPAPGGTLIEDVHACAKAAIESAAAARYRFDEIMRNVTIRDDTETYGEDYVVGSQALHALQDEIDNIVRMTNGGAS